MAEHVDNQSQGLLGKQTSTQYYIPGVALSRGRHVFDGLHKGSLACPLGIERFSPESTRRSIVEHDCSLSPFTGICSPKAYRRRTKYSQLPTAIFPLDQAGVMPAVLEVRYPCWSLKHILQIINTDLLSSTRSWLATLLHFFLYTRTGQ